MRMIKSGGCGGRVLSFVHRNQKKVAGVDIQQ